MSNEMNLVLQAKRQHATNSSDWISFDREYERLLEIWKITSELWKRLDDRWKLLDAEKLKKEADLRGIGKNNFIQCNSKSV